VFQGHFLLQGYCYRMESLGYPVALPSYGTLLSCTAMCSFIALFLAIGRTVQCKDYNVWNNTFAVVFYGCEWNLVCHINGCTLLRGD
jgi:hypothetical protein